MALAGPLAPNATIYHFSGGQFATLAKLKTGAEHLANESVALSSVTAFSSFGRIFTVPSSRRGGIWGRLEPPRIMGKAQLP